jgi:hypothetical protein
MVQLKELNYCINIINFLAKDLNSCQYAETFSINGEAMDINSVKLLAIDCFCYTYKFQSKLKIFFNS